MRRYRTEILVPPDRTVTLHLPGDLPDGWATVTVQFHAAPHVEHHPTDADPDHQDIEWWEEFDDEEGDDSDR